MGTVAVSQQPFNIARCKLQQSSDGEKLLDLILMRAQEPESSGSQPYYTTGSIVAAALMRVAVIGVGTLILSAYVTSSTVWWVAMVGLWALGVYPAWIQYQKFHERVDKIQHGTLCGACRHFNPTNQLCMVLDEHVVNENPPCEGEAWEPLP